MKNSRTSRTTPASTASSATAEPVTGSQKYFRHFLPVARRVITADVLTMRGDGSFAYHNVADGVAAVLAERDRLERELPTLDVAELESLPDLALGVIFAAGQVDREQPVAGEIRRLLVEGRKLRRLLLSAAEVAASAGLIPEREVEVIREGRGDVDSAQDLSALSALYNKYGEALKNSTPITADQIRRAGELGAALQRELRPIGMKRDRRTPEDTAAAIRDRDQLFTLLVQRHDRLWRAGAWLFGSGKVDATVPALQGRRRLSRRAGKDQAPAVEPPAPPQ